MKKTRLMAGLLLVMLFTAVNCVMALAGTSKINGHLDSVEGKAVSGWLWDSGKPEESQTVTVTVTDEHSGQVAAAVSVLASEYRGDLTEDGMGTGNYGFHVEIDWDSLPPSSYIISLSSGNTVISRKLRYASGDAAASPTEPGPSWENFKLTAYCPCRICSEGWGRRTSSGALATASHTVAVDPRVIPIGSRLLINGQEYVAEDIGGAVKGHHIDVYYNTHAETRTHGTSSAEVFLIQE